MRREDKNYPAQSKIVLVEKRLVPCALSPTGEHWLTIATTRTGTIKFIESECTRKKEVATIQMIGGVTCRGTADKILRFEQPYGDFPKYVKRIIRKVEHKKETERGAELRFSLTEKWASKVSGLPIVVVLGGLAIDCAMRARAAVKPGSRKKWLMDTKLAYHEAAYLFISTKTKGEKPRCSTCFDNPAVERIDLHVNSKEHKNDIVKRLRSAVDFLNNLGRKDQ